MSFGFGFGFPRGGSAGAWSPFSLFTGGVQGAYYDPSYLNTYMSGLGPELVAPINFNTGWTASGAAITVNSATSFTSAGVSNYYNAPFTVGRWYAVTINATFTGSSLNLYNGASAVNQITPAGLTSGVAQTFYFLAVATQFNIRQGSAGTVTVNSISVKEVTTIANATMFTTSAGTTPVTAVEQNVGLILDQSQGGVGPELVTNGGFSSSSNWTLSSTTITGGNLVFGVASGYASQAISGTAGTYKLLVNKSVGFAGAGNLTFAFYNAGSIVGSAISIGSTTLTFGSGIITASGSFDEIRIVCSTTDAYQVDSVSLIRAPGNHAYVTADANRGILRSRFNQLTYSEQFDNAVWQKSASFIQTNLLTYSEQFDNAAAWTNVYVTISANAAVAPDGTTTGDFLYPASGGNSRGVYQRPTLSSGTFVTTIYAKAAGKSWVSFVDYAGGVACAWANVSTGAVGTVNAGYSLTITAAENGWYRLQFTQTAAASNPYIWLTIVDSDNNSNVTVNGTDGIYLWGAQLVQGSVPGDYRATTASALPILYTDPLGGLTAQSLTLISGSGGSQIYQVTSITSASLTSSIWVRADADVTIAFGFFDSTGDVTNINVTTSWQRFTHTRAAGLTSGDRRVCWLYKGTAGGTTVQVWGGQFVPTAVFPTNTYQRIAATTDYATGPAFPLYIQTDGTNDAMLTNTINFANGPSSPPLGPELVTNGDFSAGSTGWTLPSGWAISGGAAVATAVTSGANLESIGQCVAGRWYYATITVSSFTAGGISFATNGAATGQIFTATGTYTQYFLAPTTGYINIIRRIADFTGTIDNISVKLLDSAYAPDKMTVTAGVTKLSDAAAGIGVELSADYNTNAGSFVLAAPNDASIPYLFAGRGTAASLSNQFSSFGAGTFRAPDTCVLTGTGNIPGDSNILRRNDIAAATATGDQGTGTYGNYPLYLLARANASLYFNGYFYGAVVVQKLLSAGELASVTNWMEVRTFGKDMSYSYDYLTLDNGDLVTLDNGDPVYTNIYYS